MCAFRFEQQLARTATGAQSVFVVPIADGGGAGQCSALVTDLD